MSDSSAGRALTLASQYSLQSISFPPIGGGGRRLPCDQIATCIVSKVVNSDHANSLELLTLVRLVAFNTNKYIAFDNALQPAVSGGGAMLPIKQSAIQGPQNWPPPSASTFDTVAASLPALAAPVAALQASHAALQVAASGYSASTSQAPPAVSQPTPPSHSAEVLGGNCPSSSSGSTGSKGGPALPPVGPPDDPDDDPERKKRDKDIDNKRKGQFLIDSTAIKTAKGRTRGSMKCEVERFERGTDLTIKD